MKSFLSKFYSIRPDNFYLYLKEYEFRFNNRNQNIEQLLLNIIKIKLYYLARIIHKSKSFIGGEGWSSPSIAGQERGNIHINNCV